MASEAKTKSNKQSTLTFTLPVSCQICLGKVKQPVLCPNLHVFCQLCLDTWLERHNQCPACRVDIGPDNPVKHIIGGQIDDNTGGSLSTRDLRRARFDLLYKEYEDQFEKMRKECIILRTENNILLAQLKDAEEESENQKNGKVKTASQAEEGPCLLLLTKNLQEAEKLYNDIKDDMARLKQENNKLKDENVNLTRENENLRLEIAQRSPKKFGRYTVATLESKIGEQEKEIRQLTNALERSDSYIEDLQRQLEKQSGKKTEKEFGVNAVKDASISGKARFQINLEPKHSTEDGSSYKGDQHKSAESAKRILFGKVFVDDHKQQSLQSSNRLSAEAHCLSIQRPAEQQTHPDQIPRVSSSFHFSSKPNDRPSSSYNGKRTTKEIGQFHFPESIMKPSQSEDMENEKGEEERDKTPRKVHFSVPGKTNDTSSFDLEMPSPMEKSSLQSDSHSSSNKTGADSSDSQTPRDNNKFMNIPMSDFDKKVLDLLQKNNLSSVNKTQLGEHVSTSTDIQTFAKPKKKGKGAGKKGKVSKGKKTKTTTKKIVRKSPRQSPRQLQDTQNSSHLSVPDGMHLGEWDASEDTKREISDLDLDLSMTPEMTDCLQLMHQAERNIVAPETGRRAPPTTETIATSSTVAPHQIPRPSSVPPHLPNGKSAPTSQYLASSATGCHGFAPASSTISGWEQQFFSSLKANPYRHSNISKSHDLGLNIKQEPGDSAHGEESGNFYSSLDPLKKNSAGGQNFHFSEPIRVNASSSQNLVSRSSFSLANPTQLALNGLPYNPFAHHMPKPSSSTTPSVYSQVSSSQLSSHPSNRHPSSSSTSSGVPPLSSYTSSLSSHTSSAYHPEPAPFRPSHSTHPTPLYDNPLPPSLNNSELEWPEDTPGRGKKVFQSYPDDLPRPNMHSSRVDNTFSTDYRSVGKDNHYSYIPNVSDSDFNASSFLPEPKKRLFDTDDDLDFSLSPKTSKR